MQQQIPAAVIVAAFIMGRHNGEVALWRQARRRRMANMTLKPCRVCGNSVKFAELRPGPRFMSNFARASFWMALWICCTLSMTLAGRELSRELLVPEIMALRSFMAAIAITPFVLWSRGGVFRTRNPGLHFIRNLSHFGAQFFWFVAVALIPLAEVVSIEFTMPIWTAILAALLLQERLTSRRLLTIGMGFAGVLIILRPGVEAVSPGVLAALAAALGFSLSVTLVKKLTGSEAVLTILAHMFWTQASLSLLLILTLSILPGDIFTWVWPSSRLYPFIALMGVVGSAGHYCLTQATARVDATVVGPMDFVRVPLTALMGYSLYGEPLTAFLFIGAAFIMTGNLLNSGQRSSDFK